MIQIIVALFKTVHKWMEANPVIVGSIIIPLGLWVINGLKLLFERHILKDSARKIGLPAFSRGNVFHFGAQHTRLYGRDYEIEQLKAFCKRKVTAKNDMYRYPQKHPVLWWMVSGEGGSGKSKLCYEFLRKMKHHGWTVCMPTKPTEGHRKESLEDASRNLPNKTLFLLDYAEYDTHVINEWINALAEKKRRNGRRIRIILIQRREKEGYGSFPKDFCYDNPLELKAKLSEDALSKIIKNFAKKELKRKLTKEQPQKILQSLNMVDSKLLRPLFAIILTSAEVDGVPITSKDQALNYIYNHQKERYAGVLRDIGYNCSCSKDDSEDNLVLYTVMTIITFATIAGSLKLDNAGIDLLPLVYRRCAGELSLHLKPREGHPSSTKKEIELFEWKPEKSVIECTSLEPDIIGEFFVLAWLKEIPNDIAMDIISAAWTSAYFTMRFVNKLFQDYKSEKWIFDNKTQSQFTVVKLPVCMNRVRKFEFAKFAQMTELTIPGNIKTIEESAFFGCKSLVKVTIENGVETIEGGAFSQCTSLRIFSMADTVTHTGEGVFSGCKVLSTNIKYSSLLPSSEIDTVYQAQIYSKRYFGYEWMVLDYKDEGQSQALLMSKYVLETLEFDASINDSIWDTARGRTSYSDSTIRKHLPQKSSNSPDDIVREICQITPAKSAYSLDNIEREICPITIAESTNTRWGTTWGNPQSNSVNVKDYLWLFSCEEAEKYFPDHKKATTPDGRPSNWWLRTCGINDHFACVVNDDGLLDFHGLQINQRAGLRPAFWLNITRE